MSKAIVLLVILFLCGSCIETNIKNKLLDKVEINIYSNELKINGKKTSLGDVLLVDSGNKEIIFEREIFFKSEIKDKAKSQNGGVFKEKGFLSTAGCLALLPICLLASAEKNKLVETKYSCSFRGSIFLEAGNAYSIEVNKRTAFDSKLVVSKRYHANSPILKKDLKCTKQD